MTENDPIAYWRDEAGPRWVEHEERLDAMISGPGRLALEAAGSQPGERVLDVGCGCGATSLDLAERVSPGGRVLGVDVSTPMLARARERASSSAHGAAIEFREADAQTAELERGAHDVVHSRFGIMFFRDPVAAFANLRRGIRSGGRLSFVCWRGIEHNPWIRLPLEAIAAHVELPAPPPPGAPGPFSLADGVRVDGILGEAGWAEVDVAPREVHLSMGGGLGLDEAARFFLTMGPVAAAAADASPDLVETLLATIRSVMEPHASDDGVSMTGSVWLVTATSPG